MSTTFAVNGRPVTVDDFQSTSVAVQNTGAVPLLIEPLGRTVAVGATVTVPGWSGRRTRVRTAGQDGTAVVTLTAGSPAAGPGPGGVTFDPGPAASMSLSIAGGTWYTNEGLTTAVSFPLVVTTPTVLYPSAPASVVITATVGTTAQVRGMNVVDGAAEAYVWTPTTDAERAQTGVSAGGASFGRLAGSNTWTGTQDFTGASVTGVTATPAPVAERGAWATATAYALMDTVTQAGLRYVCHTAHTSGTFATDLAASKWTALEAIAPLGSPVGATKTSGFVAAAGNTYLCDASGGAFSVECPPGAAGDAFRVVNSGATGTVTIIPPSGSPGGSNIALASQYQVSTVECIAAGSWIGGV